MKPAMTVTRRAFAATPLGLKAEASLDLEVDVAPADDDEREASADELAYPNPAYPVVAIPGTAISVLTAGGDGVDGVAVMKVDPLSGRELRGVNGAMLEKAGSAFVNGGRVADRKRQVLVGQM